MKTIEENISQYFIESNDYAISTKKIKNEINLKYNLNLDLDEYSNLLEKLESEDKIWKHKIDGTKRFNGTESWSLK